MNSELIQTAEAWSKSNDQVAAELESAACGVGKASEQLATGRAAVVKSQMRVVEEIKGWATADKECREQLGRVAEMTKESATEADLAAESQGERLGRAKELDEDIGALTEAVHEQAMHTAVPISSYHCFCMPPGTTLPTSQPICVTGGRINH